MFWWKSLSADQIIADLISNRSFSCCWKKSCRETWFLDFSTALSQISTSISLPTKLSTFRRFQKLLPVFFNCWVKIPSIYVMSIFVVCRRTLWPLFVVNWQNNWNIQGILTEIGNSETSFGRQKSIDCVKLLKSISNYKVNKLVFAHLKIKSIRSKFEFLVEQVKGNIDVLMILETKIDDSFPIGSFVIDGYSTPYRKDRSANDGRVLEKSVMRKSNKKIWRRILKCRCFKQFSDEAFREILTNDLCSEEFVHNDKRL